MTSKQLVYEEIKRRTLENNIEENEIFTANDLATSLNLSRNTVSQYLNVSTHLITPRKFQVL